jgi:hypothetical protein
MEMAAISICEVDPRTLRELGLARGDDDFACFQPGADKELFRYLIVDQDDRAIDISF